jgi:hypothetical protein
MSTSDHCFVCQKSFKRLFAHLAQSAACKSHFMLAHDDKEAPPATLPTIPNNDQVYTSNVSQGASHGSRPNLWCSSSRGLLQDRESGAVVGEADDELRVEEDVNDVDDDFVVDDDGFPDDDADDQDVSEEGPDLSVLDLYLKLFQLRANPLGLARFSREEKVQIELLQLLRDLKCPLKAFTLVLKWAAKSNGSGHTFREGCQPTREKVITNLYERYNMNGLTPKEKKLYLPYTQRTVSMIFFDASEVFASLLSCPTLNQDENYFFDCAKDPFVAPQTTSDVGDIHTGRCYRKTYEALIKKFGVDMLLPCIMAMDKTHIDMAGRLQMEPITISHGLLNHVVRRLPIAMRILGYINHSTPAHLPSASEHDSELNVPADLPKGTLRVKDPLKRHPNASWSTYILNETHMQIQFILEESGFLRLQKHGFRWDLHYKEKIFPVVFHPYVPFIIGDTEGHDRLCGHYTARFSQISQLCRICECPTYLTGYSKSKFPHRLPKKLDALVCKGSTDQLQLLSQHYLKNGFADVRFGLHNQRGIFGACPGEMLHLVSLGWFKYCLLAFAAQAGPTSLALKQYDMLCAKLGMRLSRQSDRDIPRTNFPKGFSSGTNLMGHEMTGCLLVKLFALHTSYFRSIFDVGKKVATPGADQRFRYENHIQDWIDVVSSLLAWHQWMKQPTISKKLVRRSHACMQWLMRSVAEVAPRPGGMTNNTIKRHLVLHLCEDILDHGVPDNVNSAYAESAHIPLAKLTSRNTQKRAVSFTKQAAHRYVENLVVSLASADVYNDMKCQSDSGAAQFDSMPALSGRKAGRHFDLTWPAGDECATFRWTRPRSGDDLEMAHLSSRVLEFLTRYCLPKMPKGAPLPCFTSFIDADGNRYRAHPCYDGKVWNDHAMSDWVGYPNPVPLFIHTFVDLRGLPEKESITIHSNGQKKLQAGLYAVAHTFDAVDEGDLDTPNTLVGHYTPHFHSINETRPTLFLANVESILSPILGIPDVYFAAKPPRRQRHHLFLIRRKADWPRAWDSLINKCHHDLEHDEDDDTWFEEEYEKEFINRLPSGREIHRVKTPEEFGAEVTAKKAEKAATKKKKEDDAAAKASAKAAKATAAQQPAVALKRKRVAPVKTSKGG